MNTKINKMTYLFPRSIFLVIRQSFDLAMLATNMKPNADNSRVCHIKQNKRVLNATEIITESSLRYIK